LREIRELLTRPKAPPIAKEICRACNKAITGTYLAALNAKWHEECLICTKCKKSLENFGVHDGKVYCETHYAEVARKKIICFTCGQLITSGKYISELNRTWHTSCFACSQCGNKFDSGEYLIHNDAPFCSDECINASSNK